MRVVPLFKTQPCNITIGSSNIPWCSNFKYLGQHFSAGKSLVCDLHPTKAKFFGALNGIFSKLGSSPSPQVTLAIIFSKCVPILLYGLEAVNLTKAQCSNINFVYNSIFAKIFHSFDKNIIMQCQFYSGYLPASYLLDRRRFKFLAELQNVEYSQNKFLLHHLGMSEYHELCIKYFNDNLRHEYLPNPLLWSMFSHRISLL